MAVSWWPGAQLLAGCLSHRKTLPSPLLPPLFSFIPHPFPSLLSLQPARRALLEKEGEHKEGHSHKKSAPIIITTATGGPDPLACLATATRTPYAACAQVGPGVRLLWNWTTAEAAATGGRRLAASPPTPILTGTLEAADPAGYASWGWPAPATPGKMKGGRVLVLRACATCPSGAALEPFSLTGYTSASVQLDAAALQLGTGGAPSAARRLPDGAGLAADFSMTPPPDVLALSSAAPFIAATGPLKADGRLAIHTWAGDGDLDLGAGSSAGGGSGAPTPASLAGAAAAPDAARAARRARNRKLLLAHAVCMVAAWCVLVPLAIGLSAAARDPAGRWFKGHWGLNAAATALSVAGLGLGRAHPAAHKPRVLAHSVVGYVVVAASLALALAGAVRPAGTSRHRPAWTFTHRWGGLLTAAVAFANAIAGFWLMRTPVGWPIGVGLVWGALVLGFSGKAWSNARRGLPYGGGGAPGDSPLPSVRHSTHKGGPAGAAVAGKAPGRTLSAASAKLASVELADGGGGKA